MCRQPDISQTNAARTWFFYLVSYVKGQQDWLEDQRLHQLDTKVHYSPRQQLKRGKELIRICAAGSWLLLRLRRQNKGAHAFWSGPDVPLELLFLRWDGLKVQQECTSTVPYDSTCYDATASLDKDVYPEAKRWCRELAYEIQLHDLFHVCERYTIQHDQDTEW